MRRLAARYVGSLRAASVCVSVSLRLSLRCVGSLRAASARCVGSLRAAPFYVCADGSYKKDGKTEFRDCFSYHVCNKLPAKRQRRQ